nr:hypothetical protein [Pseudomonas viridiflava]
MGAFTAYYLAKRGMKVALVVGADAILTQAAGSH